MPVFPANLNVTSLNGVSGFSVIGFPGSGGGGFSVSGAGDINGDGIADLVVGAPLTSSDVGASYVIFGRSGIGSGGSLSVASLNGSNGFSITGFPAGSDGGYSVCGAGDINRDGIADLVVGAPIASSNAGVSYVIFGQSGIGSSGSLSVASLTGPNGFSITGFPAGSEGASSVSGVGDINGDGIADLLVGALYASGGNGVSYVIFGQSGIGSSGSLSVASLTGSNGFSITGFPAGSEGGSSVSGAGDINGDGIADLVVGAPVASSNAGASYVIFGHSGIGSSGSLSVASLTGPNGFSITGFPVGGSGGGSSVSGVGDINGDGIADLMVGAPYASSNTGASYVIFGQLGIGSSGSLSVASLTGSNGFSITGFPAGSEGGSSVSGAGDINGDGIADLVVGAPYASPYGSSFSGASYVIFGQSGIGSSGSLSVASLTGPNGFSITEFPDGSRGGYSVSGAGDINWDGIADLVVGAPYASSNVGVSYVIFGEPSLLILTKNRLSIKESQTLVIGSQSLNATAHISAKNSLIDLSLQFNVVGIQHGRFYATSNPSVSLTSFTQQQVRSSQIQFAHDGSGWAPAYNVSVSYKLAKTPFQAAQITFQQSFVLVNNQLTINRGQTVILTSMDLSANDLYNSANNPTLLFVVSNVQHGYFALTSASSTPITQITQAQILSGDVQFVQDGSGSSPSYNVAVINGVATIAAQPAVVSFSSSGLLLTKNSLIINQNQTVIFTLNNINATDPYTARFNFTVSGVQHGYFSLITAPLNPIISFTPMQIQKGQVQFKQDGSSNPPSYSVMASDGQSSSIIQAASVIFDVFPTLITNTLTINQGQTVILTSLDLSATDSYNPGNNPGLIFSISHVQHGFFALTSAPSAAITQFTQAQIQNSKVQFVQDGSANAPSFDVAVINGVGSTLAQAATISFDIPPVLVTNSLTINQGQAVVLSLSDLSASDPYSSSFIFTVSNVQHGYFALTSAPILPITSFTQTQLQNAQVQFVQDGSVNPPSYWVSVSDGRMSSSAHASIITFHSILSLVCNTLSLNADQSIVLTPQNLNATDLAGGSSAQIIFTVADVTNGYFAYIDFPTLPILSFSQADIDGAQVKFVSTSSNQAPSYSIAVSDGTAIVSPVLATITFGDAPQILVNQITISQGGAKYLDLNHLHAQAPGATNSTLLFLVNDVHHGQFENYGQSGTSIGNFTQQQLINDNIQFVHDGSNFAPGYSLTAFNMAGFKGSSTKPAFHVLALNVPPSIGYYSAALPAKVWFQAGGITLPQLKYNRLLIKQGGKTILDSQNILAIDIQGSPVFNTTFLINSLTHGQFASVTNPTITNYLNFSQSQVIAGEIQFVHDGSANAPSYEVVVNQGPYFSTPYPASIAFLPTYIPPQIIGQLPAQTVTVEEAFTFPLATSAFSDATTLHFSASQTSGSQLPSWIHFDNVTNYFSGIASIPGITSIQITAKNAAHLTASTFFLLTAQAQSLAPSHATSHSSAIIGGAVGGAAVLMLIVMRYYLGRKAHQNWQKAIDEEVTQKTNRFIAKEIFEKVKFTGCFSYLSESDATAYIKAIESIISKLEQVEKTPLTWVDEIAIQIKKQANKSFCYSFFKPEIMPQELTDKAEIIAQAVQQSLLSTTRKAIHNKGEDVEMSDVRILSA